MEKSKEEQGPGRSARAAPSQNLWKQQWWSAYPPSPPWPGDRGQPGQALKYQCPEEEAQLCTYFFKPREWGPGYGALVPNPLLTCCVTWTNHLAFLGFSVFISSMG